MTTTLAGLIVIATVLILIGVIFFRHNIGVLLAYIIAAQGTLAFLIYKGHADTIGAAALGLIGVEPAPMGVRPPSPPPAEPSATPSAAPAPAAPAP